MKENSMLPRERFLRLPGQSAENWAWQYGVEPFSVDCIGCGVELTTSIPFACGAYRGLVAPECECGDEFPPYAVVARDGRIPDGADLFKVMTDDTSGEE